VELVFGLGLGLGYGLGLVLFCKTGRSAVW